MSLDDQKFDDHLRQDLGRLADSAPSGPNGEAVFRALRRRRARRGVGLAAGVSGLLVVAALVLFPPAGERVIGPGAVSEEDKQPVTVIAGRGPSPLSPDASPGELESGIRQYFTSIEFHGRFILEKVPGEDLSYAFSGGAGVDLDKLRTDLDSLLRNFETVSLDLRNGHMRYTLLSLGRSSAEL
jgi:hypothetical protein